MCKQSGRPGSVNSLLNGVLPFLYILSWLGYPFSYWLIILLQLHP